jgi:alkanesulfonate monooxygenase SsuD/methylene tetrahydromethanopterin reductase-like flavin-dependent oxidoreductase (luciferase family)
MGTQVEVGVRVPHELVAAPGGVARFGAAADAAAVDRLWVGDHVSFKGGQGYDGLLMAAALAAVTTRVTIQTAVYLLPLRHPMPVARQVAGVAQQAPGRLIFGVGVGGEDPREVFNCGVNPATRGRRMDESLELVRRLLAGHCVDHSGDAFALEQALIRPVPDPAVPIVVGGRSPAALRRAGRLGDGWLGVWVDPDRYRHSLDVVAEAAEVAGRPEGPWDHGLLMWCGIAPTAEAARPPLAAAMESLYKLPFERFARYSPAGRPQDVAEAAAPFVEAGMRTLLLAVVAEDAEAALAGAGEVRTLLRGSGS